MATKRKVPMTKAGKPDKRYVKSVNAKSKVTGKSPSKRTKARRAKPQLKGYSANPSKSVLYIQEVKNGSPVGKKFYYIQLSRDYYGSGIGFVENKKDASNVSDPESVMKRVFAEWNKHYAKGSKDYNIFFTGKKPQLKGYSANPAKKYYTVFAVKNGDIVAYWDGAVFDTDRYEQKLYSNISDAKKDAEKIAEKIKSGYRVGYGREPDPIKK